MTRIQLLLYNIYRNMLCLEFLVLILFSIILVLLTLFILCKCGFFKRKNISKILPFRLSIKPPYREEQVLETFWKIHRTILETLDFKELTGKIVNLILQELGYLKLDIKAIVFTLVDREKGIVKRVSVSPTEEVRQILSVSPERFEEIEIPINAKENLLVKVIETQKASLTHDLSDVFVPVGKRETWRNVQKDVGIKSSLVFPLLARGKSIGAMIFSVGNKEEEITPYEKEVIKGFVNTVAMAVENVNLNERLTQTIKELKDTNIKLEDLDKRKDEFLSVAAHELRAPMTAIKGYLSMILEGDAGKVPAKIREFLDDAVSGNDRLIRLVNNMLNVSRIEEGRLTYEMGVVSLAKVADDVYDDFIAEAEEKGLSISLKSPPDIKDRVYVDKDRIHEVIGNLISNAVKYTDKGSVTVRLSNPTEESIRFEVVDTGSGISEKDKGELFKKFSRAETSAGKAIGSGLGLYISKLLVEKFGGKIGLESKLGKGSTFWFEIPIK